MVSTCCQIISVIFESKKLKNIKKLTEILGLVRPILVEDGRENMPYEEAE
jgi:hypothetical protein